MNKNRQAGIQVVQLISGGNTLELLHDSAETNDGVIGVNMFNGTVMTNNGNIRVNGGRVDTNNGRIRENCDVGMIITNRGRISANNGDVGTNYGKVTNTMSGVVDVNAAGGTVICGTVREMCGGTALNCAVTKMCGGTARGEATVIGRYEGGRVSTNIPRESITLAEGLTDEDIEWVAPLRSEKNVKRLPASASVEAL